MWLGRGRAGCSGSAGEPGISEPGSGAITNGTQLFSNVTPQLGGATSRLGFNALAQWDKPTMGGNGDGADHIQRLRVFPFAGVDRSYPQWDLRSDELLTMAQAGITAISADYIPDNWTDQFGNRFQDRAQITWASSRPGKGQGNGGGRDQWAYDVVLLPST